MKTHALKPSKPEVWIANQDFNCRNIKLKKGDILPEKWQNNSQRAFLTRQFGSDCIRLTNVLVEDKSNEIAELKARIEKLEKMVQRKDK